MAKLKLEIDALRVESFDTTEAARAAAGTVRAHNDAMEEELVAITTPQTREFSCLGTCKLSCWGTCDLSCDALCSLGCSDGCTAQTCLSGGRVCCA